MKSKYAKWYRILEEVFGAQVPHLSDDEISRYVSEKDWMIIPLSGESDKNKAKAAQRPNLYISLDQEDLISFGIVYEKLASVDNLRTIILPYNERERNELLQRLSVLDGSFLTTVNEKIKLHHPLESPDYNSRLTFKSRTMNLEQFIQVFKAVDKIMAKRELLDTGKRYQLAPTIGLVYGESKADEQAFREAVFKIKPIYELTIKLRSEEDYSVCEGCLCFVCPENGEHENCKCPCSEFPKHVVKKLYCYNYNQSK